MFFGHISVWRLLPANSYSQHSESVLSVRSDSSRVCVFVVGHPTVHGSARQLWADVLAGGLLLQAQLATGSAVLCCPTCSYPPVGVAALKVFVVQTCPRTRVLETHTSSCHITSRHIMSSHVMQARLSTPGSLPRICPVLCTPQLQH